MNYINLVSAVFFELFFLLFLLRKWGDFSKKIIRNEYIGVQVLHDIKTDIPRLGGLCIYLTYLVFIILESFSVTFVKNELILLSFVPTLIISVKEDIYHNVRPLTRLAFIFLSCLIAQFFYDFRIPLENYEFIYNLFKNIFILNFFYLMFISGIVNGMNILDGSNGIACFTAISILSSLFYLTDFYGLYSLTSVLIILVLSIILFLLFNFPFGKVFLGDSGAYFLGFSIALICSITYSEIRTISFLLFLLILFYPAFEVFFSLIRKVIAKKNPFSPDNLHLHLMLYKLIFKYVKKRKVANNLTSICLLPLCILSNLLAFMAHKYDINVFYFLIFMIIFYCTFYYFLFTNLKNKKII